MATAKTETPPKAEKLTEIPEAPLTLQQKFVKLREAVPAITQKQHSDGVKYKFAKIFDVYELLTPAMNQYGVNFDIVAEVATRHDENGDAKYYDSYVQQTRNGVRTVWVYEADITIRWTNADDQTDTLDVTLHALGTNDGGPDKAKGSAWTYCLKYYLFEKFGIDQGEDDPDMKDLGADVLPPPPPTGARNSGGGTNTKPKQQNALSGLTDAQLNRMYIKGESAGFAREQINARIAEKYGQQDPHNLTRQQYEEICNSLDAAAQKQQEGANENGKSES